MMIAHDVRSIAHYGKLIAHHGRLIAHHGKLIAPYVIPSVVEGQPRSYEPSAASREAYLVAFDASRDIALGGGSWLSLDYARDDMGRDHRVALAARPKKRCWA
jgi:hypothetical protein